MINPSAEQVERFFAQQVRESFMTWCAETFTVGKPAYDEKIGEFCEKDIQDLWLAYLAGAGLSYIAGES